jgi:hypothetical protein
LTRTISFFWSKLRLLVVSADFSGFPQGRKRIGEVCGYGVENQTQSSFCKPICLQSFHGQYLQNLGLIIKLQVKS